MGDPSGNRWTTAVANPPVLGTNDLQYLLNKRAQDFNLLAGIVHRAIDVPIFSTTDLVVVRDEQGTPPYGPIIRVEDDAGKEIVRDQEPWLSLERGITGEDLRNTQREQRARKYLRGLDGLGTIRLLPAPAKDGWIRVWVVAPPLDMLASNDIPWIGGGPNTQDSPAQYHSALVYGAAADALLWNKTSRDEARSAKFDAIFQAKAQQAAAEIQAALSTKGAP